jgi:hypothetical protein
MACSSKLALTMLLWGSLVASTVAASAQMPLPAPAQPAVSAPAQPAAQATADPIGSVATLEGSASVTHDHATSALQISDAIFKGDALQTGVDGTLGITFDDETTFTLKPNSRIDVDDYVYQEGGAHNAAVFKILSGTVAFVAAEVAHTGDMKIDTPTSSLGIRGTTGLIEVPAAGAGAGAGATGEVSIKLYPDADGRVGRIEVFGRDGSQLGILTRGATGFAVRGGAPGGRFTAVPLQISAAEAERDRSFVRQAFATRTIGRQINIQRRNFQRQNPQRRNELRPGERRLPGQPGRPGFQPRGGQPFPGARPLPQRPPGGLPGQQRRAPVERERKQSH